MQEISPPQKEPRQMTDAFAKPPLLSICIPTYNRCTALELFLPQLLEQTDRYPLDIEVLVSDNCSSDSTNIVIDNLKQRHILNSHRHTTNIGASLNIRHMVSNQATGDFCWVIGDDDIVPSGAIERVINKIKTDLDIDYIFASEKNTQVRDIILNGSNEKLRTILSKIDNENSRFGPSRRLKFWELVDPSLRSDYLGFISNSIFRRSLWMDVEKNLPRNREFESWEGTYPHLKIFMSNFMNREAFYISETTVICGDGVRDWQPNDFWSGGLPLIFFNYFDKIISEYKFQGLPKSKLKKCQIAQAILTGHYFIDYLHRRYWLQKNIKHANQIKLFKMLRYANYFSFWTEVLKQATSIVRNKYTQIQVSAGLR
jgi:glycosyltransferase involved in cell wall biosynthesis